MRQPLQIITVFCIMFFGLAANILADYPEKPITIVVHSKPGSGIDITSRQIANIARKYTDATVLVENKSGGSGLIAMRHVLGKKANGYTVLAVTKSFISTVLLSEGVVSLDEFDFFACMVIDPEVLITNRTASVQSLQDLIIDAKEKNGKQRWLGPLVGGVDHLMAVQTWDKLGISGEWIPYEGGSDALAALLGKHGVVYVGNPVDVKGRPDLMLAAVAAPTRLPNFPDVPTFIEHGYDIKDEVLWRGFAIEKGTDPDKAAFLADLFEKISKDPDWLSFINNTSAEPVFYRLDTFTSMVQQDQQNAVKYLKLSGIMPEASAVVSRNDYIVPLMIIAVFFIIVGAVYKYKRDWINSDSLIAASIIAVSVYLYTLTLDFPVGKLDQTAGPSSMPRLWIYGLIIFSIYLIITAIRSPRDKADTIERKISKSLGLIGLMVGYMVVMKYLGYLISTFLFLVAGIYLLSFRKHLIIIITVIAFVVLSYLAFYKVLQVPLPVGMLFE